MPGDIEVQDAPPVVADDEEAIKHAESESRDGEEIHGSYRLAVIAQKASQRLAGSGNLGARLIQRETVVSDTSKPTLVRSCISHFSHSPEPHAGEPRPAPTTCRLETQASQTQAGATRDKLFWLLARRFGSRWKELLVLVLPETVPRWHRAGFKAYWAMLGKVRKRIGGGRRISKEIRELIFRMVAENPTWGAPRIHGELLMSIQVEHGGKVYQIGLFVCLSMWLILKVAGIVTRHNQN